MGKTTIEWAERPQRFWSKVDRRSADECWPWKAAKLKNGYGAFSKNPGLITAHRAAYVLSHGPVAAALKIDHLCRNRLCCNPRHLEAVTNKENCQRGLKGRMATACKSGHSYTQENTGRKPNGTRFCRECRRIFDRKRGRDAEFWREYRLKRKEKNGR